MKIAALSHRVRCQGDGKKYMVLMYAEPAATEAMPAADCADVFRRHEALHQDLAGSGEMPN